MLTQEQKQDYFDRAVAGLAGQGFDRARTVHGCSYRTPEGKKCALGHLIPDDKYDAGMEGGNIGAIRRGLGFPDIKAEYSDPVFSFFSRLQTAHDASPMPANMRCALRKFASVEGLTTPPELAEPPA